MKTWGKQSVVTHSLQQQRPWSNPSVSETRVVDMNSMCNTHYFHCLGSTIFTRERFTHAKLPYRAYSPTALSSLMSSSLISVPSAWHLATTTSAPQPCHTNIQMKTLVFVVLSLRWHLRSLISSPPCYFYAVWTTVLGPARRLRPLALQEGDKAASMEQQEAYRRLSEGKTYTQPCTTPGPVDAVPSAVYHRACDLHWPLTKNISFSPHPNL